MSGVEALAALGIIANVFGVVDFTSKALGRIKETRDNINDIPKAFRDVRSTLPLLENNLKKTEQQIRAGAVDEDTCKALRPILEDYFARISELQEIFEACLPKDGSSKINRGWNLILSLRKDKKVEEISEQIRRDVQLLVYHHVTAPPIKDAEPATAGLASLSMSAEKPLKAHFMVPIHWSDDFTGRQEQLDALGSRLCQEARHARVAIVGLGGIGKTRLALQFVTQLKGSETSVFWIHAASAERMRSASRDIAKKLGVSGWDNPNLEILELLKVWFESEQSGRWLIVYDNADNLDLVYANEAGALKQFFPRSDRGAILMTTRNRQIGIKFATAKNVITLSALTDNEAVALITAKLGEEDSEPQDRIRLAESLSGIPLALVQAVSFIEENNTTTIKRYLELYDTNDANKIQLLSQDFEDDTRDLELKNPVATTWVVTFEYLKEHQSLAADTLCMMSMVDAHATPESFISNIDQGVTASDIDLDRALGTLQAYSLISFRNADDMPQAELGRLFDLHPLVRLVTRNWLNMGSAFNHWMAQAIDTMSSKYDKLQLLTLKVADAKRTRYLPHTLALIASPPLRLHEEAVVVPAIFQGQTLIDGHADKGLICPSCTASILSCMYQYVYTRNPRLGMVKKAVAISSSTLGRTHPLTLTHRFQKGLTLMYDRRDIECERVLREIIADCIAASDTTNFDISQPRLCLAQVLSQCGHHSEAEQILRHLIETQKPEHGKITGSVRSAMRVLANDLVHQGRSEEAKYWISQISDDITNTYHVYELAGNYLLQRQYSKAEEICLRTLNDRDGSQQDDVFGIDNIWYRLAEVYRERKIYAKEESCLLQVLTLRRKFYRDDHPQVIWPTCWLLSNYRHRKQYNKCEPLHLLLIEGFKHHVEMYGDLTPWCLWDLAYTWRMQGKVDESRKVAIEVVATLRKKLGERSKETLRRVGMLLKDYGVNPDGTEVSDRQAALATFLVEANKSLSSKDGDRKSQLDLSELDSSGLLSK